MILEIPTRTDLPHYSIEVELDQQSFTLEFRWNDRAEGWFMDVSDVNGVRLLNGRRVCVDLPLLARFRDPALPAGELLAVDTAGTNEDPGIADLGARVKLLYYELADIPTAFVA
jgi:hypothetical protein